MYLSLYCKGSKRVTQGLRVRGSWRPNINCNILTPTLMAVNVVSFSFSWCSTRGLLCWVMAFFTASYQHLLWSPNSIGVPEGPFGRVWLSLPHLVYNSVSNWNWNSTELYNSSRPLDLWNRMLNRHQAEITFMQFTGHSLPVRQSMSVPWEFFYLVPFHRPISAHAISSHNCHYSNGSYERKSRGRKLSDEMGQGKKIPMVHS